MAAPPEGEDPVDALTERTRNAVGPLIDAWAERIRDADLREARSLEEFRGRLDDLQAWTETPRAPTPDVDDVVAALGPALAAAEIAGRYDVEETPIEPVSVELASAAFEHTQLPFAEQIEFFRSKLDLPTETWTDIWHAQHDRAFVVAGAAHADLVADLRGAVDQAIADGTTLATFRKDFDAVVAKHGWSYKGARAWRTEVIYATNLRTSYHAGRYQQMKDTVDRRPYWRYRHSHASEHPRAEHLAWDGLVLRHDDPWWDTHYTPNGWGCQCYVESLSERDLKRLGKSGPDTAPDMKMRTVTVGEKGPSPRTVEVPWGIDPGWAYAPGQSVVRNTRPGGAPDPWAIGELSRADAIAKQLGGQGGSNPGGLFQGADGTLRYVKFYEDAGQAYGEAVANRAYRELGLDAPISTLVRDGDAIVGIANEIIDHAGIIGAKLGPRGQNWQPGVKSKPPPKGRAKEVLKGYSADAWLLNWDVLGRDMDNIVKTRDAWNSVARIDQGGALLMRGLQGRKRSSAFDAITEWDGFASPQRNPSYAAVLRAAGYESADELGRQALNQIKAIGALGRRTDGFKRLAPAVQGISEADHVAIQGVLAQRARLLETQIAPRVRAAMRAAKDPAAHQARTRAAMGEWYTRSLAAGKRKVARGAPRMDMTDPELAAAYAYTAEESVWSHYKRVNGELRKAFDENRAPPRRVEDYMRTLDDALDKLPDVAGTFYRGAQLSAAEKAAYTPGSVHTWAGFSSSSRRRTGAFHRNTRFILRGRHGKDVKPYSAVPGEDEVLFKASTKVRVVGTPTSRDGVLEIPVVEVGDA